MENYDSQYATETRTFEYRNIYVREYGRSEWKALLTATLSTDTFWDNKKSSALFGAAEDRFYGITSGYGPDAFELNQDVSGTYTVEPASNIQDGFECAAPPPRDTP